MEVRRDEVFREAHLSALKAIARHTYVLSAPAISQRAGGANMSVDVPAFAYVLDGARKEITSTTNLQIAAADAKPRIDLIYVDEDGLKVWKGVAADRKPGTENNWLKWEEPYPKTIADECLILAEVLVGANVTEIHNEDIRSVSVEGIDLFQDANTVKVSKIGSMFKAWASGEEIYSGGSATAAFEASMAACNHDYNIIKVGIGEFKLICDKIFYLSGTISNPSNPFYYAIGAMDGQNVMIEGAGPGLTVLKLEDGQHYNGHHCAMILSRSEGPMDYGHTGFGLKNLTLDGNRAGQNDHYVDGAGLVLTGSIRVNEVYENLEVKNSYGYGIYVGNNGSGPADKVRIKDVIVDNCYKSGIAVDTISHSKISDCIISNASTGLEILGNTDYLSRTKDNISVSGIIAIRAGLVIWCINDISMVNCQMDIAGALVHSYGLQVHSSVGVNISSCRFKGDNNNQYVTYIDSDGYIQDGPCKVTFTACDFDGYRALKAFGKPEITVVGGTIKGYGACLYFREFDEVCPVVARFIGTIFEPVSGAKILDAHSASRTSYYQCHCETIPSWADSDGIKNVYDCIGSGFEGRSSRWREENPIYYTATPADVETITTTSDRRGWIKSGTPARYIINGETLYGIVTYVDYNRIVVAGAPLLGGNIQALYFGDSDMVTQIDYLVPGVYDATATPYLIYQFQKSFSFWRGRPAYLVQYAAINITSDSGTKPRVNVTINAATVGVNNSYQGIDVTQDYIATGASMDKYRYRIQYGQQIELSTTQGGSKDAMNLSVHLTFVSED